MRLASIGSRARVDAEDRDLAAVRRQQPRHHAQCRRLARAIGAEQRVEFAGAHLEVEPVDRRSCESLAQVAQDESGRIGAIVDFMHQSLASRGRNIGRGLLPSR